MNSELSINDVVAISTLFGDEFCASQSPDNIALLAMIAKQIPKGGTYIEIGTRTGVSTIAVALANLNIHLYCIDRDTSIDEHLTDKIQRIYDNMASFVPYNGADWRLRERIHFVGGHSQEILKRWKRKADFLFHDADHSETMIDDLSWLKFVKVGGFAGFHDYADDETMHDGLPNKVSQIVNDNLLYDREHWILYAAQFHMVIFRKLNEL